MTSSRFTYNSPVDALVCNCHESANVPPLLCHFPFVIQITTRGHWKVEPVVDISTYTYTHSYLKPSLAEHAVMGRSQNFSKSQLESHELTSQNLRQRTFYLRE